MSQVQMTNVLTWGVFSRLHCCGWFLPFLAQELQQLSRDLTPILIYAGRKHAAFDAPQP